MPPVPARAPARGGGLRRKLGPFPLWLWLAGGGGLALLAYLYLRGRAGAAPEGEPGGPALVTGAGAGPYTPLDAAGAGAPAANGMPAAGLAPEVLQELMRQREDLAQALNVLPDRISESLAYNLGGSGAEQAQADAWSLPDLVSAVVEALGGRQAAPVRRPAQKPPRKAPPKPPRKSAPKPPRKAPPKPPRKAPPKPPRKVAPKPPRKAVPPRRAPVRAGGGRVRPQ